VSKKPLLIFLAALATLLFVVFSTYFGDRIYRELTQGSLSGTTQMYQLNTRATLYGFAGADYSGLSKEEVNDSDNSYLPTSSQAPSNELLIDGRYYHYVDAGSDAGMDVINASPTRLVATLGGKNPMRVNDSKSTLIIGHNPGLFSVLPDLELGQEITAYDTNGHSRIYKVTEILNLNRLNLDKDGKDYTNFISAEGEEEQLLLETDVNNAGDNIVIVCR
jgi:hypothetical protein